VRKAKLAQKKVVLVERSAVIGYKKAKAKGKNRKYAIRNIQVD
jgi:hypothetical protein